MELIFNIEPQQKTHQRKSVSDAQKGMLEQFKTCPSIIIKNTLNVSNDVI